jgi:hypothetical protein
VKESIGWIAVMAAIQAHASMPQFWINELHYDNSGTDSGEFVEVIAPAGFTELAAVQLTLYNGGDGGTYGTSHLLSSFTPGKSSDGFTVYSKAIGGQQNGAPDGLSLDLSGEVLHFISYEGVFTATAGPALGLTSTDLGVMEEDSSPAGGSLGLTGFGSSPQDFTWASLGEATPGSFNVGQMMIPEPGSTRLFLWGIGLVALTRRPRQGARRRTH